MSLMSSWTLAHLQAAGYNAGDASTFFELPESGTVLANFLDHYSNFDTIGRYVYRVSPTEFLTGNKFTNLLRGGGAQKFAAFWGNRRLLQKFSRYLGLLIC